MNRRRHACWPPSSFSPASPRASCISTSPRASSFRHRLTRREKPVGIEAQSPANAASRFGQGIFSTAAPTATPSPRVGAGSARADPKDEA